MSSSSLIDARAEPQRAVAEAVRVLRGGGVVVLPTETVYGIAADAGNPAAMERIYALKGRERSKPIAYLMADAADAEGSLGGLPEAAKKLAGRYWPGPLTLVLGDREGNEIGLRVPGNELTRTIIRESRLRIQGTSANLSGQPPAATAEEARKNIGELVDLIIDRGPSPLREPSTVVRVTPEEWEVLRRGAIDEERIELLVNKIILFVCSGNSCRSPMAEGICRGLLSKRLGVPEGRVRNRGFTMASAGIAAEKGSSASPGAVNVMREFGVDIGAHRQRRLTRELARQASHVYVMDRSLLGELASGEWANPEMREIARELRGKVRLLGDGIRDPYGGSVEQYRECARELTEAISSELGWIVG